jgi:GntR family transcriptional regulator
MADRRVDHLGSVVRDSPVPLYHQLKQLLLQAIDGGTYRPGQAIPGDRELEEHYGVSQITVRRALAELAAEGYIVRERGRGSFVRKPILHLNYNQLGGFFDALSREGFLAESHILQIGRLVPSERIVEELCVTSDRPLLYFERLVYADGEPLCFVKAYFDVDERIVFTRQQLEEESAIVLLEREHGITLAWAERTIGAALATGRATSLLEVEDGVPMLSISMCMHDVHDKPIGLAESLYRGDRYQYKHRLTK